MYRRQKFLTVLHEIREAMSREADYDVDLFAEMIRSGAQPSHGPVHNLRGFRRRAPSDDQSEEASARPQPRKRAVR